MADTDLLLASQNVNTYVPAYTNGVQAQPISLAHYLLAYDASFGRDAQRIQELYKRMNRSAMGTAVLANSSGPNVATRSISSASGSGCVGARPNSFA